MTNGLHAPLLVTITCLHCRMRFEAEISDTAPMIRRSDSQRDWVVSIGPEEVHRCAIEGDSLPGATQ